MSPRLMFGWLLALCLSLALWGCPPPEDPQPTEPAEPPEETATEPADETPEPEPADEPAAEEEAAEPEAAEQAHEHPEVDPDAEPVEGETVVADDDAEVAEINIGGNDQMQFDVTEFVVQSGQTVRLTLTHTGVLPLQAMGHNVVILEEGVNPVSFGAQAVQQGGNPDNEYLPEDMRDQVIAFTPMIGGGDETTIEFEAPEPGEYAYVCTFPGHFAQMVGTMIVEE